MKVASTVAPHIDISFEEHHGDFKNKAEQALGRIASGTTGKQLIDGLEPFAKMGKRVKIQAVDIECATRPALTSGQASKFGILDSEFSRENNEKANQLAQKRALGLKGEGSAATIDWNAEQGLVLDENGVPISADDPSKSYLALAHEMIHASRIVKGTFTGGNGDPYDPASAAGKEELRAVGLGEYQNKTPSENSIRQEHNEPLRTAYPIRPDKRQDNY